MATAVTEQQLIAAILAASEVKAQERGEGYLTSREIAQALTMSEKATNRLLHLLDEGGLLEASRIYIKGLHGSLVRVPAYRVRQTG